MNKVQTRGNNGQFTKEQAACTEERTILHITPYLTMVIVYVVAFLVITPILYHILIRKSFFTWLITTLDKEFGCSVCSPCICNMGKGSTNNGDIN
jgi:hypothetical protein